jgi:Fe-S-cluster containining protein
MSDTPSSVVASEPDEGTIKGCDGSCCAAFVLQGSTYRQFRRRAHRVRDGETIANMIIPISPKVANERLEAAGSDERVTWKYRGMHFTCKHWDPETKLCGIYEDRPSMCRDYPYEKPCVHCGVTGGCDRGRAEAAEKARKAKSENGNV